MDLGPLGDRYQLVRPIGRGATTMVLQAWDRLGRRHVALKVPVKPFAGDEAFLDRLHGEVWAVAGFAHANVATVHAIERAGPAAFVVVELVDGSSLRDMLGDRGPLPPAGAARVAAGACAAVAAAHARGIAHGHLVPANVLLAIDGRVKVTDFRLAQAARTVSAPADPAGDVRALGGCLAAALTGREPAGAEAVRLGPAVPAELAAIVARAAGDRHGPEAYRSAAELGRDLARFLAAARPGLGGAGRRDMVRAPVHAAPPVPAASSPPATDRAPLPAAGPLDGRATGSLGRLAAGSPGRPAAGSPGPGRAAGPLGRPAGGRGAPAATRRRRRRALLAGLVVAGVVAGGALAAGGLLDREPGGRTAGNAASPPPTAIPATTAGLAAGGGTAATTAPRSTRPPPTTAAAATAPSTTTAPGAGPGQRVVPDVVGLHRQQAADVLARAQLGVQVLQVPVGESGKVQRVVAQQPSAGQVVPARSEVVVLVGSRRQAG
jgi:tRNA A-37 threonylcarbamoyl transferase component Bud32